MLKKLFVILISTIVLSSCTTLKDAPVPIDTSQYNIVTSTIEPFQIPPEPVWFGVVWDKGCPNTQSQICSLYCLDEQNAKNLLKNHELTKSYINQLKDIIKTLNKMLQR